MFSKMMTQEQVRQMFDYNSKTGKLRWRVGRRKGRVAGSTKNKYGYVMLILGKHPKKGYYGHRLAWLWVHGEWPSEIDHVNGQRSDNRLTNLRLATRSQNMANAQLGRKAGKGGLKGIHFEKRNPHNPWIAKIQKDRRQYHLGCYATPELAHAAYYEAAKSMYGEFARRT